MKKHIPYTLANEEQNRACYNIKLADMDADVITFEAARAYLSIIDALVANNFRTEVGPGVYDILD